MKKKAMARYLIACTTVLITTFLTALTGEAQTKSQQKPITAIPSSRSWAATSSTAMGITGDIRASPGHLVLAGGHDIALSGGRSLTGQDLRNAAALFPVDIKPDTAAVLYHVRVPAAMKFKNGNTLCGAQETSWMLVVEGHTELDLAPFSGTSEPNLDPKIIKNSTALCGTLSYTPK